MIAALLYLQYHSIKNRTVMRVKRLKQPKYLLGGIVGAAYFYFFFFRRLGRAPGQPQSWALWAGPADPVLYESLGALVLLAIVLLAWLVPHERAALAFTEAEVAFLFPAPISRRGLIHFKLLRSQTAILFTTLLLTLATRRAGGNAWIRAAGWWLVLSTLNLHFLGSSFARTMLLERGITNWQRRLGILALVLGLTGAVIFWARRTMPAFDLTQFDNLDALQDYLKRALISGPAPYLLYPFRLVVRPYLAPSAPAFLWALAPALLLLLLHYGWVIRSNVAFEEASVDASRKLAEKVTAIRAGNWRAAQTNRKAKRPPFTLRSTGPQAVALLWKNLISAGQVFTLRVWVSFAAIAAGACYGLRQSADSSGLLSGLGLVAAILMLWSLLIGPQFLRQDLRQDLLLADVLKMFPMRGWQIALGEILAPAVILTGIQWFLLIIAVGLFSPYAGSGLDRASSLGLGVGLALIVPMLNLITLQIPNAAVLLFPAWFQTGKEGPHGIEATGQRLIFMLGQLLVFIVALIPVAACFLGLFFLLKLFGGVALALPLASIAAALVLTAEALLGLMLLGWLFERFDLSAELGP